MNANIVIGIVEDNSDNIATLKYSLGQTSYNITVVHEAKTADEAYELLMSDKIELAFLDIQLRDNNIFSVLEKLYKENRIMPELVFTTAHGSFENALKAIQFACLDFVTKPFSVSDIEKAIQRYLIKKDTQPQQNKEIGFLLQLLRNDIQSPKTIAIQLQRGIIEIVDLHLIQYIEADENISRIHLVNDQLMNSSKSFGHYLSLLSDNNSFLQISKSIMVNVQHIKQYHHQEKTLKLKSNNTLVVSHRFSTSVQKFLLHTQKDFVSEDKFGFIKNLFKK